MSGKQLSYYLYSWLHPGIVIKLWKILMQLQVVFTISIEKHENDCCSIKLHDETPIKEPPRRVKMFKRQDSKNKKEHLQ